jgi:23S rRNA (cytidine2498-2'-O)-methyltransferase
MLATCQSGYEDLLAAELAAAGVEPGRSGPGWAFATARTRPEVDDWCFAHAAYRDPHEIQAGSVNALAAAVAGWFCESARTRRFEGSWPFIVQFAGGQDGLGRRASAVESAVRDLLRRRMARVARLASTMVPGGGLVGGLFVFFTDFDRVLVARDAWFGGQRRMADDPAAPSRSYLKVEEAYGVLGVEPMAGENVADLGAAPGGWSYSAARRGARVIAIDNGPLKGGALGHSCIEHRREDAFKFEPVPGQVFDWLFCDLVDDPHHVMRSIVERWLRRRWCRRFIVNLKFGRADAIQLVTEVRRRLGPDCASLAVRHLYHDREEITVVGTLREGG